jgi:RTX calcium-binding nonapeptide repeat (4 copies)
MNEPVANPYPSTIDVAGLPGTVVKARVTLSGISHPEGDDIDVLLAGPGGQRTTLMGAVCGPGPLSGTLVFDDAAAPIPAAGPCPTGTYSPNNVPQMDSLQFPSPAPPMPYALALSTFNGSSPNGSWRLFVLDIESPNNGSIAGGWSLDLLPAVSCAGKAAALGANVGTPGNDLPTGTSGPDVMLGLSGNDEISGLGGNDVVCGGEGDDKLRGGAGRDLLRGEAGKDKLNGGGARDALKGGGGRDNCIGGGKSDTAKSCEKRKSI